MLNKVNEVNGSATTTPETEAARQAVGHWLLDKGLWRLKASSAVAGGSGQYSVAVRHIQRPDIAGLVGWLAYDAGAGRITGGFGDFLPEPIEHYDPACPVHGEDYELRHRRVWNEAIAELPA